MAYISFSGAPSPVTNPWAISGTVTLGDVVYQIAGADKTVARAKADDASKVPPLGVVTGVSGSTVQVAGNGETVTGFSSLTPGTVYWLSTIAGGITSVKPASNIYLVGVAVSENAILVGFTAADLPAGGGGGGTVTSIGVTSSGGTLSVSGSPVTTSGSVTVDLNTVAIASGGTGQTTKTDAFDALSPTTTKGDLITHNGTDTVRFAVGSNNTALRGNTTALAWANAPGTVTSVAVTNADGYLTITGSPITSGSGTINLSLNIPLPVAKGGTGLSAMAETGAMLYGNSSGGYTSQNVFPYMRNRIVNGNMSVNQRSPGNVTANGGFVVDRWINYVSSGATAYAASSVVVPTEFSNSILFNVTTGSTSTAAQYAQFGYKVEGTYVSDLGWGTSSAKTITISFWVRSSLTGTYCVGIRNSAYNRSYIAQYTVSAANTWERKSITIAGDTSGTWSTDTGIGLQLNWDLGSGSNYRNTAGSWLAGEYFTTSAQANVIGTSGATFYLTGVQLEVGTVATPFEPRQPQTEIAFCQRYFAKMSSPLGNFVAFGSGHATSTTAGYAFIKYPVTMRSTPTIAFSNVAVYDTAARAATAGATQYGYDSCRVTIAATGLTSGYGFVLGANNIVGAYITLDAEL